MFVKNGKFIASVDKSAETLETLHWKYSTELLNLRKEAGGRCV